jgi:hypothetical protein
MSEQYIESSLTWKPNAAGSRTWQWLRDLGLGFIEMKTGLLLTGNRTERERHFKISLDSKSRPMPNKRLLLTDSAGALTNSSCLLIA